MIEIVPLAIVMYFMQRRWEIEARRRWEMEEAARQANATPVSQPKKVAKPTSQTVSQPKSSSLSDQQFYDKFGIWPDEMGEHPYNPPTR